MSFINKVTGAESVMGAAITQHFTKLNARLYLIEINLDTLMKVSEECENISKTKVLKHVADISTDEYIRRSVESALKEFGKIDILVKCAGLHGARSVRDPDIIEKYNRVMSVNLRAVIAMTSQATPALIDSKGCVINISSIGSSLTSNNTLPYNLSKAGVTYFTKCAALDLAKDGVRVNCTPGPVKTNLLINAGVTELEHYSFWDAVRQATLLKRMVKVEEIAELVAFLASDKANSITETNFVVDSGLLLGGTADAPGINLSNKQ